MVPMLPFRVWVHCPRASNGLLPPRSYPVGYLRWYAGSDSGFSLFSFFLLQTIIPTAFSSQTGYSYLTRQGIVKLAIRPETYRPRIGISRFKVRFLPLTNSF